ncbi:hypothetical protein JOQ06_009510, partial [Pogonophryne albipinna]
QPALIPQPHPSRENQAGGLSLAWADETKSVGWRVVSTRVIDVKVLLKPTLHAFGKGEWEIGPSEVERRIPITQLGSAPL